MEIGDDLCHPLAKCWSRKATFFGGNEYFVYTTHNSIHHLLTDYIRIIAQFAHPLTSKIELP